MQVIYNHGELTANSPMVSQRRGSGTFADRRKQAAGFSLVEILAVLAIASILLSFSITAIQGLSRSIGVTQGGNSLMTLLERTQLYATANSTYSYLGLDASTSPGDLKVYSMFSPTGETVTKNANLFPIGNLVRLSKISVAAKSALPSTVQTSFSSQGAASGSGLVDVTAIPTASKITGIILSGKSYSFDYVIQFGPDGSATAQTSGISRWIQIGLTPTQGSSSNPDVGLLQVTGLTGSVQVYRP